MSDWIEITMEFQHKPVKMLVPKDKIQLQEYFRISSGGAYPQIFDKPETVKTVVDIGAHVGIASVYFHLCYPNATIYAFEPAKRNHRLLVKNIKSVDADNSWFHEKRTALGYCKFGPQSAFLRTATLHHGVATAMNSLKSLDNPIGSEECTLLDAHHELEPLQIIDVLKIDAEASELDILQSLQPRLRSISLIHLEFHRLRFRRTIDDILEPTHILAKANIFAPCQGELTYVAKSEVPDEFWNNQNWTG